MWRTCISYNPLGRRTEFRTNRVEIWWEKEGGSNDDSTVVVVVVGGGNGCSRSEVVSYSGRIVCARFALVAFRTPLTVVTTSIFVRLVSRYLTPTPLLRTCVCVTFPSDTHHFRRKIRIFVPAKIKKRFDGCVSAEPLPFPVSLQKSYWQHDRPETTAFAWFRKLYLRLKQYFLKFVLFS